jgi:DNA modification methylase
VSIQIIEGDCRDMLATLPVQSVHCCVTSPPYFGLRDYGVDGQIGLEPTPDEFVAELVAVFREVRRVLRDDGTVWLNLGDSYGTGGGNTHGGSSSTLKNDGRKELGRRLTVERSANAMTAQFPSVRIASDLPPKNLLGIPWRVAFALQADGWYLRQDIIWHKPNPMPESVTDRCTKAHEYVFLLSKSARYFYDAAAIAEPVAPSTVERLSQDVENQRGSDRVPGKTNGTMKAVGSDTRNARSVWTIATQPFKEAHFATFPPDLAERCIKAGCPKGGTVLDPFGGAGTTGLVADRLQRNAVLIELNPAYADIARRRIEGDAPLFSEVNL